MAAETDAFHALRSEQRIPMRLELHHHPVLDGVDFQCIRPLLGNLRPHRANKGALVSGPHLPPALILVLDGYLHAFTLTRDGQRLVLEVIGPGDVDGMLVTAGINPHMCVAITDAEIVRIPRAQLESLIESQPHLGMNLYSIAVGRLARRESQMSALSEHSSLRALARQLLSLAQYAGRRSNGRSILRPRPTHQALADMLGLRRETITCNLKILRTLHAVEMGPHFLLVDEALLASLLLGRNRADFPAAL